MQKLKKDGKLPFSADNIFQFHEDFFIEKADGIESTIKYTHIEKLCVGKDALYLYLSCAQACIIPFSAFASESQYDAFFAFIRKKVANA